MIARLNVKKWTDPQLVALFPLISNGEAICYCFSLPTREDLRFYANQFPSLQKCSKEQREAAKRLVEKYNCPLEVETSFNPSMQLFN